MRALLVNPWIYDFACYDLFSKPIGILQIAALLKKVGFEVEFIDCLDRFHPALVGFLGGTPVRSSVFGSGNYYSETVKKPDIFKEIRRHYKRYGMPPSVFEELLKGIEHPDIILVTSGMTYWYKGVCEAIEILKEQFPHVPLVLGGIYATLCYEHASEASGADFVFKGGDIEAILKSLFAVLNRKLSLDSIPTFLSPAYELYPQLHYVSLRTSSGCPYRCTYCGWYVVNPQFYQRNPDEVVSEIAHFYKELHIRNFAFYDDALFYNPQNHIIRILRSLLAEGISAHFHTPNGLHARFLNRELSFLLRKAGFVQPRLGFESAHASRQKKTGGKVSNRDLSHAVDFLKEAGYQPAEIGVYLMIGLPQQSSEEVKDSIYFVHTLKVRVYLEEYSPVPGTPDYRSSGLNEDSDPLLHNNSVFPFHGPKRSLEFQRLKDLNHRLNQLMLH